MRVSKIQNLKKNNRGINNCSQCWCQTLCHQSFKSITDHTRPVWSDGETADEHLDRVTGRVPALLALLSPTTFVVCNKSLLIQMILVQSWCSLTSWLSNSQGTKNISYAIAVHINMWLHLESDLKNKHFKSFCRLVFPNSLLTWLLLAATFANRAWDTLARFISCWISS